MQSGRMRSSKEKWNIFKCHVNLSCVCVLQEPYDPAAPVPNKAAYLPFYLSWVKTPLTVLL